MPLPPVAQAFADTVAACKAALTTHRPTGLHVMARASGPAQVRAMGDDTPTPGPARAPSAHAQMAWAMHTQRIQKACKAFQKACKTQPHLAPLAKRLEIQMDATQTHAIAWEWGNLDFGIGYSGEHALTMPATRVVAAIADVETATGPCVDVLFHNRAHTRSIGRCRWPAEGARRFAARLDPKSAGFVVGFARNGRFLRNEPAKPTPQAAPNAVQTAFEAAMEALNSAPYGVESASLLWCDGRLSPYLWLRQQPHRGGSHEVGPHDAHKHPFVAGTGWLERCEEAAQRLDAAIRAWLPCAVEALDHAPLCIGFNSLRHPHLQILGMTIHNVDELAFPLDGATAPAVRHTTQGGAQHMDVPAVSPESAAGFVRLRRNLRQQIEVWAPL